MLAVATLCSHGFAAPDAADSLSRMLRDVQELVDSRAKAYNCSFSVALKSPSLDGGKVHIVAAGGATTSSRFAWGSITKMWTGASIMQLVAQGVLSLDEPAAPHVDAQLAAMKKISFPGMEGWSKLSDLYGEDVNKVTIRNLLAMQSGIPDFDTATPSRSGPDLDSFRATVYAHPTTDYFEPTLMSEPWVALHKLTSTPGEGFHYSSTNFGLLGLILAHHAGVADIRHLDQSVFIPPSLSAVRDEISWAMTGSPAEHGVLSGYDRTDYNGQDPKKHPAGVDVSHVNGVFAGFTASDFVGTPGAVAELGYALWGSSSMLMPAKYRDMMVPNLRTHDFRKAFYGLASQNVGLMGLTGGTGDYAIAYGHLGATYGYDSILGYNPKLDLAIAVASNIETPEQLQPSDAFCRVFNRAKNFVNGETVQTCSFSASGYYGGKCSCK